MIELEVNISSSAWAVGATDPHYDSRQQLVERAQADEPIISAAPRVIGALANREMFSAPIDFKALVDPKNREFHDFPEQSEHRILRKALALRLPFEIDSVRRVARYCMPDELGQFSEAITIAARREHAMYPRAIYDTRQGAKAGAGETKLSIEQNEVSPGFAQRRAPGDPAHRDGSAIRWLHLYMASDVYPTEFFEVAEPGVADRDAAVTRQELGDPFVPAPFEVVFANSTTLHRSPVIAEETSRTFMRLLYDHVV